MILKLHPSSGFKSSVVVVSPLEYKRKQQVENIKKEDCGITAATIGESVEVNREIETGNVDIVYGSAERWWSDRWRKALLCGNLHQTKVLVVGEVSHSCNLISLIQHDNVNVKLKFFVLAWNEAEVF